MKGGQQHIAEEEKKGKTPALTKETRFRGTILIGTLFLVPTPVPVIT